jgi:ATP-binding cassette, subfamily C, bacterial CydCD
MLETVEGIDELAGRGVPAALRIPVRRGQALARSEARAAGSAGAATALAHLGFGAAVIGTAFAVASSVAASGGELGASGAELAAVLLLGVVALAEPVLALPDAAIARHRGAGAGTRLAALGSRPTSATSAAPAPIDAGATGTIAVRGLVAGWDPARPPALNGLDLDLPAGSRIAVLGPSGCGKSTLAAVLARLLDPVAGSVHRGSTGRVAMVGDDVDHVFASTVRENLRMSRPDASDDDLLAALIDVRLGDWLAGLPSGLDTWLGEGGTTVSGGERRRLVTARALLAEPDLLVLDEPTEGLDEPTAEALMTDLLRVTCGRRVLLLTHRREGLDQVDAVQVLEGGRLRTETASMA